MLHFRLHTWDPRGGAYVSLPEDTRLRAVEGWFPLRRTVAEGAVVGGIAALDLADVDGLRLDVSLEGDAIGADGARVPAGTAGSWTPPDPWAIHLGHRRPRGGQGTLADPYVLRLGREAFLRLVWWCETTGSFRPAPAGLRVTAWDAGFFGDHALGSALTDANGCVRVPLAEDAAAPDLCFTVEGGAPPLPEHWSSRDDSGVDRADRSGYWRGWAAQRLGTPEEPYTFALDGAGPRSHPGNTADLLVDGPPVLAAWEAAIAAAEATIHFEVMLYFDDATTRRIQAALLAKARAGVRVRLLLGLGVTRAVPDFVLQQMVWNRVFRRMTTDARAAELARLEANLVYERARAAIDGLILELMEAPNVTVLDTSFARVELLPGVRGALPSAYDALEGRLPWFTLARVDHRKLLIVDGRVAVLGGHNVGQEYAYERPFDPAVPDRAEEWVKWHDVSVRLAGPAVGDLQHRFRERWVTEGGDTFALEGEPGAQATFPPLAPRPGGVPVRIVDTTPGARRHFHATLLAQFAAARRHIYVLTPYFSDPEALGALTAAARRGVAVTLVLPYEDTDSLDFLYAARLWYAELMAAGVAVYEYQHHMTHAKVAVVDDVAVIGTGNLNHSSFHHHYELAAVIADAGFARATIAALWERDLHYSRRIAAEDIPSLLQFNAAAEVWLRTVVHTRF